MYNTDGRMILTAEVTKNKIAETSKIYLNNCVLSISLLPVPWGERKTMVGAGHVSTCDKMFFYRGRVNQYISLRSILEPKKWDRSQHTGQQIANSKVQLSSKPLTGELKRDTFFF